MMDSKPDDSLGAEARMEAEGEALVHEAEQDAQLPVAADADGEAWQIVETIEDMVIAGRSNQYMKNEFYYEFEQGQGKNKREVRGLTASAYAALALTENITIEKMEVNALKSGYEADAVAWKVGTELRAYGTGYAPYKDQYGKLDPFAKQKAMTRAARNARKQLLPFEKVVGAISQLAGLPNTLPPASHAQAQALPAGQAQQPQQAQSAEDTPLQRALKRGFAVYANFKEPLAEMGIDEETFWQGVRLQYKVNSRTEMKLGEWNNLVAGLEFVNPEGIPFAKWIRELAPEEETAAEASEETTETPPVTSAANVMDREPGANTPAAPATDDEIPF